jgi:hypothetical protein
MKLHRIRYGVWRVVIVSRDAIGREVRATGHRHLDRRSALTVARIMQTDGVTVQRKRRIVEAHVTPDRKIDTTPKPIDTTPRLAAPPRYRASASR